MNDNLELAFRRHTNMLQNVHARIQECLAMEHRMMILCLWSALLVVPLPWALACWWHWRRRTKMQQQLARQLALAVPGNNPIDSR